MPFSSSSGKSASGHLVSCRQSTSGCADASHSKTLGRRTLIELTFQLAIFTTIAASADRERVAAAAGRGGVRVLDLERGAHHVLDEVDLGAGEEVERDLVNDDLDAVAREDDIALLPRVVEAEAVLEAGAAAARDGDAQERALAALPPLPR